MLTMELIMELLEACFGLILPGLTRAAVLYGNPMVLARFL